MKFKYLSVVLALSALILCTGSADAGRGVTPPGISIQDLDGKILLLEKDSLSTRENFNTAYLCLKQSFSYSYTRGKAVCYRWLGTYFMGKRKHASAIRFLLASSQLYERLKDTAGMMYADHSLLASEIYLKNYDNALETCRHGLELARQKRDLIQTGLFLESMADIFHEQQDTIKSLDYYLESLKYYTEANHRKSILDIYMSIGGIYLDQKKYTLLREMYDTLCLSADTLDRQVAGTIYTRLAHIWDQQGNTSMALKYNRKALECRRQSRSDDLTASSLINIAGDFFKMNQADSGISYCRLGIETARKCGSFHHLKRAYALLYNYYLKKQDSQRALENYTLMTDMNDSTLKERLNTDISGIKANQYLIMLKETNRLLEKENFLQRNLIRDQSIFRILLMAIGLVVLIALAILVRGNISHRRSKRNVEELNIKLQHEAAESKMIQKKTIEKDEHYRFIAEHSLDLINRIDRNFRITYASPSSVDIYGYGPDELRGMSLFDLVSPGYAEPLKEQLEQVKRNRHPHTISFLARKQGKEPIWLEGTFNPVYDSKTGNFTEFVAVTRNIQELKKREMGIVEGTRQKENLLREIHHRVKNNFAILVSLINMQKAQTSNDDVKQSLTNLQLRIRTMALVHEMLYRSEDFERISFPDYVRSVASVISSTYGRLNVNMEFDLEPVVINIETAIPLGLMLNELLSNAYRHAFDGGGSGMIRVSFRKHQVPGFYSFIVSDNGRGLPADFSLEGSKTMGLQIVDILIKQIEGKLEMGGGNGASFSVIFPMEA